jgi:hypothetical protein
MEFIIGLSGKTMRRYQHPHRRNRQRRRVAANPANPFRTCKLDRTLAAWQAIF